MQAQTPTPTPPSPQRGQMTKSGSLDLDFDFAHDHRPFSLLPVRVDGLVRAPTSFLLPSTPGPGDDPSFRMGLAAGTNSKAANTVNAANNRPDLAHRHTCHADSNTIGISSNSNSNMTPTTTSTNTTTATSSTAPTIIGSGSASATSSTTALHRHSLQPIRRQMSLYQLRRRNSKDASGVDDRSHRHGLEGSGDGSNDGLRSRRHRYHHSLRLLDKHLWPEHRPSSSRSHIRYWSRSKSPVPNASQYLRASTDGPAPNVESVPSMAMSKGEFETLPPTIQRKYFSTLERLRFAHDPDCAGCPDLDPTIDTARDYFDQPSTASTPDRVDSPNGLHHRPSLRARLATDPVSTAPHRRRIANPTLDRIYSTPEAPKTRTPSRDDKLFVKRQRQSVILDATDESLLKIGKRQTPLLSPDGQLDSQDLQDVQPFGMHAVQNNQMMGPQLKETADSLYDSFRWLEEDEDLDLRLFLDDYHFNLRQDVPAPSKSRRPSFRRHLSISKLPFGRPSTTLGRADVREFGAASPTSMGPPPTSVPSSPGVNGHGRRRSRALSLISPNKQPLPDISTVVDPAAAHYQDPEARMKLRVYLASAHKFDEAIEFGFPSTDEVQDKENCPPKRSASRLGLANGSDKPRTFLEDDKSSMYTDEASATEPDTPKTPQDTETFDTMDTPVAPVQPSRTSQDPAAAPKGDYAQASASSREMTLRMTLTRPDLRAHEEQIYGWQKPSVARKFHIRDEPSSPTVYPQDTNSKDSIEKQFAAFDQENLLANGDNGVVRRFWNRVRRS